MKTNLFMLYKKQLYIIKCKPFYVSVMFYYSLYWLIFYSSDNEVQVSLYIGQ